MDYLNNSLVQVRLSGQPLHVRPVDLTRLPLLANLDLLATISWDSLHA